MPKNKLSSFPLKCPNCLKLPSDDVFPPTKWEVLGVCTHCGNVLSVRCPRCGTVLTRSFGAEKYA